MIDAAGKRRAVAGDAIAAVCRQRLSRSAQMTPRPAHRGFRPRPSSAPPCGYCAIRWAWWMISPAHQPCDASALAELARDLEPGVEAKTVAADARRQQDAGEPGIEHVLADSAGMRRASSAAAARSANIGASARARSTISCSVCALRGRRGGCARATCRAPMLGRIVRRRQVQPPADREQLQVVALDHPAPNAERRLQHDGDGDRTHQHQIDRAVIGQHFAQHDVDQHADERSLQRADAADHDHEDHDHRPVVDAKSLPRARCAVFAGRSSPPISPVQAAVAR